jgi:hypothetical protein
MIVSCGLLMSMIITNQRNEQLTVTAGMTATAAIHTATAQTEIVAGQLTRTAIYYAAETAAAQQATDDFRATTFQLSQTPNTAVPPPLIITTTPTPAAG